MSIVTTAAGQRYLILIGLPDGKSLPFNGMDESDLVVEVRKKVSDPNRAGEFWTEASYGKTTLSFDVHGSVLELPEKTEYYYRRDRPKTVEGTGVTYPVDWSGGETLELEGDDGLTATVTFPAGSMSLSDCVDEINDAIEAASSDPTEPEITASSAGGQVRLRTRREADDAKLEVGGTAQDELGLDAGSRSVTEGRDLVKRRKALVQHALEARVNGLSDADIEDAVGDYDGVIAAIVGNDGDIRAGAIRGAEEFPLGGENYEFSWIAITTDDPWKVYAHEIGHNLSFPDLYEGSKQLVGTEPRSWDIMGSSSASHSTGWIKTFQTDDAWMTTVEVMRPPAGSDPESLEVLLAPNESPLPSPNPFASSHPDLPFVHAIRLDLEGRERPSGYEPGNRSLYVENRVKNGTFSPPFQDATYDTDLPGQGVIITDAINSYTGVLVDRSEVRFAIPEGGPISSAGDEAVVQRFGAHSSIRVEIVDVVQNDPPVYHVRVTWGPAERFDYRIEPWDPPPWESPDIWIDTAFANGWDEYKNSDASENPDVPGNPVRNGDESRVGWPSRVYARIHNDGNIDRTNVPVRFEVVKPAAIGPAPGQPIGDTRIDIPKRDFALARVDWTPRASNEGHVCIRATVDPDNDELSELNNEAQENITEWYAEASSPYDPVAFRYQVSNPLPERAPIRLRAKGLTPGWTLEVDPYEFWLDAGEVLEAQAVLRADSRIPFDDVLVEEGMSIPVVSLEGLVLDDHTWVPFGGISGAAHAVRKTDLETEIEPFGSDRVIVSGRATSRSSPEGGPVAGATVGLRVFVPGGDNISFARAKTDANGRFEIELRLPAFADSGMTFALDAVLAPILGYGPAAADVVRFTLDRQIDVLPREQLGLTGKVEPSGAGPIRRHRVRDGLITN